MRALHIALMSLAGLLLLFSALVFGAYAYNLITFPYDYDQGEGFELVDTILFSQFELPYRNTDMYPYYASNYPPVYHIVAAPFVWVFGQAYWYGRALSAVATLITAGAIYYAVRRDVNHIGIASLSALAFIASNTIYHIGPLFRQHIMMVMFETVAVVILARAYPAKQKKTVLWGLLLIVIAGYTKQLAAFTALAVLLWMILRTPRRGITWSILFASVGCGIFVSLIFISGGEWWRQAILANVNQYDPYQTIGLTRLWFRLHAPLIIPALLLLLYDLYITRLSLYSIWLVVTLVLGAIGSGTWGAGDSYFATSIAATCILSGIFLGRMVNHDWDFASSGSHVLIQLFRLVSKSALVWVPIIYIAYGLFTFKMPTDGLLFSTIADVFNIQANVMERHYDGATYDVAGYANIGHFVTQDDRDNADYIVRLIRQMDVPVMSEEAGFSLQAERDVITNPTQLRNLWLNGLWQGDALISDIEAQRFGLIIFRAQFYPDPVLQAIGDHYHIQETVAINGFDYQLWYPNHVRNE